MKQQTKHTAHEQEQVAETESQSASVREFASAEELLRHDARQIAVPPQIAERLARSIQNKPKPVSPWWRRLLGS